MCGGYKRTLLETHRGNVRRKNVVVVVFFLSKVANLYLLCMCVSVCPRPGHSQALTLPNSSPLHWLWASQSHETVRSSSHQWHETQSPLKEKLSECRSSGWLLTWLGLWHTFLQDARLLLLWCVFSYTTLKILFSHRKLGLRPAGCSWRRETYSLAAPPAHGSAFLVIPLYTSPHSHLWDLRQVPSCLGHLHGNRPCLPLMAMTSHPSKIPLRCLICPAYHSFILCKLLFSSTLHPQETPPRCQASIFNSPSCLHYLVQHRAPQGAQNYFLIEFMNES